MSGGELELRLGDVPALLERERGALAELSSPEQAVDAERRLAAIAELSRRAGLAVPIVNEATFLRAEALERLAVLVDEGQAAGELATAGGDRSSSIARTSGNGARRLADAGVDSRRVAEGRALARTGAVRTVRDDVHRNPERLVSMRDLLKQAERREREDRVRGERAEREAVARAELAADPDGRLELAVADVATWRPAGVAAIVTDPPYLGADVLDLYAALRDFAVDVLPPGGALAVMTWQPILPGVMRALEHDALAWRWMLAWRYAHESGATTIDHPRRIFDTWKPVLLYHRDGMTDAARVHPDELSSGGTDKLSHEWGQSLEGFETLVGWLSEPGDRVCDPFLGGGTTAVAALAIGRRFVGADVDEQAVATTLERLEASS